MAGLLVSHAPALGRIGLTRWLEDTGASIGRTYANELQRHFAQRGRSPQQLLPAPEIRRPPRPWQESSRAWPAHLVHAIKSADPGQTARPTKVTR
jgi:hypothetical protein